MRGENAGEKVGIGRVSKKKLLYIVYYLLINDLILHIVVSFFVYSFIETGRGGGFWYLKGGCMRPKSAFFKKYGIKKAHLSTPCLLSSLSPYKHKSASCKHTI